MHHPQPWLLTTLTNILHALSILFGLQQMSVENLEAASWTQQSHKTEGDWIHEPTLGTKSFLPQQHPFGLYTRENLSYSWYPWQSACHLRHCYSINNHWIDQEKCKEWISPTADMIRNIKFHNNEDIKKKKKTKLLAPRKLMLAPSNDYYNF